MSLAPGLRLGPYEIVGSLGAGGMGEVYRAHDTKLGRDVAIKVLPEAFAGDPERLSRFTREAQTLASLNHSNIAHIHGLEESSGVRALVMELVEGEDLSAQIARGPVPLVEALTIAKQVAEALAAAHEQGIIHRDLKPANIKVRPDGTVKVLDFGLAKAMEPESQGFNPIPEAETKAMAFPPITSPTMTQAGMILGTAAYMSPEQAKGRPADKRSDIWAFGAVFYEVLTGQRAFSGEDMTDVLGAVVRLDPNWQALPPDLPPPVRTLLQSCLVKDQRKRIADISTALFVLEQTASLAAPAASGVPRPNRSPGWHVAALTTGALVVAAVASSAVWVAMRPPEPLPPSISRLQVTPSGSAEVTINGSDRDLAITPDGTHVVYVGNRGTQLFVRALDTLEPVAVFTGTPRGPFISPDGQWIGFVDSNTVLKKVALTGGPAVTLATLDGGGPRGASWGPDDTIIVATNSTTTGLQQVAAAGGPTTVLTRPDRAQSEADHLWPEPLPGGRAVLFTITAVTGGLDAAQVAILDLPTGTHRVLVRGASHAQYVSAILNGGPASPNGDEREGGYLVYAAAGTLMAVPFDLARLETRGMPTPVVPQVVMTPGGAMDAVVAGNGTLAYVSGGVAATWRTLVWVDRQGRETLIPAPPRAYLLPRLSPDGTRIAVAATDQEQDLWLWDVRRTTLTRATFDPASDAYPVWTADGRRMVLTSERDGGRNLFWQAADNTGTVERLTESANVQNATAVSPDGRRLIFTETNPKTGEDVMQLTFEGTRPSVPSPLVQSSFTDRNGVVSPDSRWLTYETNESGRFEVYVRPYPEVTSGHWQVSTSGGTKPLWAPSGQELFYVAPSGALMRVDVQRGVSWAATTPTVLLKEGYLTAVGGNVGRSYDVTADGQRFLLIKQGGGSDQTAPTTSLIIVQHWVEELKRLVPWK